MFLQVRLHIRRRSYHATQLVINPFTTEARFFVLNAIAFST